MGPLLVLVGLFILHAAHGASFFVDCVGGSDLAMCNATSTPCASIAFAVSLASTGDTIFISEGVCHVSSLVVAQGITIRPLNRSAVTWRCSGSYCVSCDAGSEGTVIRDMYMTPEIPGQTGAGMHIGAQGSGVVVSNVTFQGFTGGGWAGAIRSQGTLAVYNSSFLDNWSTDGAGIFACNQLTVVGSTFSRNTATTVSTAIRTMSGTALIDGCSFTDNVARPGGAAVIDTFGTTTMTRNCYFFNNAASRYTGAIGYYSATGTIEGCVFDSNTSDREGGAVMLQQGTNAVVRNCVFKGNGAGTNGGGINIEGNTDVLVENCTFDANFADEGGAMSVRSNSEATIIGCTFRNNTCTSNAAALHVADSLLLLMDTRFVANTFSGNIVDCQGNSHSQVQNCEWSSNRGTGFAVAQTAAVALTNSSFHHHTSLDDGAGFLSAGSYSAELSNMSFTNNAGRAISASSCGMHVVTSMFSHNTASGNGGAIQGNANIEKSSFTYNSATNGGAIYTTTQCQSGIYVDDSFFAYNSAAESGGAVFVTSSISILSSNFTENTASFGGAVAATENAKLALGLVIFAANLAMWNGGAVYLDVATDFSMLSSHCIANIATYGGALYLSVSDVPASITYVEFQNNTAKSLGGGTYAEGPYCDKYSTYSGNKALSGGGIYSQDVLYMYACAVSENMADGDAGGIFCELCLAVFDHVSFVSNSANFGAALSCTAGSTMKFQDTAASDPFFTIPPRVVAGNTAKSNEYLAFECSKCGCCGTPTPPIFLTDDHDVILYPGMQWNYTCADGYEPPAGALVECTNGVLTANNGGAVCQPGHCPMHPGIRNAQSDILPHPITGDVLVFTCVPGTQLQGNDRLTCLAPNWVGETPVCKGRACTSLPFPQHGSLSATTGSYGDIVTLTCDPGFYAIAATITCLGVSWSTTPYCTEFSCGIYGTIAHGTVTSGNEIAHEGATIQVLCEYGYQLNDPPTCHLGNWTATRGCVPIACENLTNIDNGRIINGTGATGDIATYECNEGYYLEGHPTRNCIGPRWRGLAPTCERASCNQTDGVAFAGNCSDVMFHGDSCVAVCLPGSASTVVGAPQVTCLQTGPNAKYGNFTPALPECVTCDSRSYAPMNSTACIPCNNARAAAGASSQADCLCEPLFFEKPAMSGICVECPEGAQCPGAHEPPYAQIGYYSLGAESYALCTPPTACGGNDTCNTGYTGPLCGACENRYYRLNGICRACPADMTWRIGMIVVFAIAAGVGLIFAIRSSPISERARGFTSLTIGISFCQVVAVFALLNVPWQSNAARTFDIASSFNLNIEIAAPECVEPVTFFSKFLLTMMIPFIVLSIMLVAWIVICLIVYFRTTATLETIKETARTYFETTMAAYLFFLVMAYLFLAKTSLSVFACRLQPDGTYGVTGSPGDKCYDSNWTQYAVLGGFGILFYMIGIPSVVNGMFFYTSRKQGGFVARRALTANFFVKKYADHAWYWETVIILRKVLIVIITVIVTDNSYRQIVLCAGVTLLAIVANLTISPYRWPGHSRVESISLSALLAVLLCALFISDPNVKQATLINTFVIIAVVVAVLAVVACFLVELDYFYAINTMAKLNIADRTKALQLREPLLSINITPTHIMVLQRSGLSTLNLGTLEQVDMLHIMPQEDETIEGALPVDQGFVTWNTKLIQFWERTGLQMQQEVTNPISCVSTSSTVCLTGHANGDVNLWNADEPELYKGCHVGAISAICASENFFLTAGADKFLRKWTYKTHARLHAWSVEGDVTCITESRNHYVYGTTDGHIVSLVETGHQSARFHLRSVVSVAIQEDVIISCDNHSIIVSDLNNLTYLQTIAVDRRNYISTICAGGKLMAYGDKNGNIVLHQYQHNWDVNREVARRRRPACCQAEPEMVVAKDDIHTQLSILSKRRNLPETAWDGFSDENARALAVALAQEHPVF